MSNALSTFTQVAREFCAFMTVPTAQQAPDDTRARACAALLGRLYIAALELEAVEPNGFDVHELEPPPTTWQTLEHQFYFEVFDPLVMSEPVTGDVDDDVGDIYRDVARGLIAHDAGHAVDAHWHWRFSFRTHWGDHATGALRALHRMITSSK